MKTLLHLNIHHLRKQRDMTQEELGKVIGKTRAAIVGYEKATISPPIDVILQFCEFFQVDVNDILFKNLAVEAYVPAESLGYDEMKDKLIALLEAKVARYEAEIKKDWPDLAGRLGLG
jgi:DNA-binding XRE family transcriptional regulator